MALFGSRENGCRTALFVIGPGPEAIQSPVRFQPDVNHLNCEMHKLAALYPGLEWIGSLHVHPFGMAYLSGTDRRTLAQLLGDQSLCMPDFVAGIIQRQELRYAIYPYLVYADDQFPWLLPVEVLPDDAEPVKIAESAIRTLPAENEIPSADIPAPEKDRLHLIRKKLAGLPGLAVALVRDVFRIIQFKRRQFNEQNTD
jgi:hypothetical protein